MLRPPLPGLAAAATLALLALADGRTIASASKD